MSGKACFTVEMGTAFFFNQSEYIRIGGLLPRNHQDFIVTGPAPLNDWPSLKRAGFTQVDAVLNMGGGVAYFFSGDRYIHVEGIQIGQDTDYIVVGPRAISDGWPSLREAEFTTVDAVLPMGGGIAYFFSGTRYIRVGQIRAGESRDILQVRPGQTWASWKSLKEANFRTIDAILPIGDNSAYFFSGDQYTLIVRIVVSGSDDEVVGTGHLVKGNWPSLREFW